MRVILPVPGRISLAMAVVAVLLVSVAVMVAVAPKAACCQEAGPRADVPPADALDQPGDALDQAADAARTALAGEEPLVAEEEEPAAAEGTDAPEMLEQINILELLEKGGKLMYPIYAMSLLVVTFGAERMLGLRRRKVVPPELVSGLGKLAGQKGGLEPRQAYKLCQQFPSTASTVIKTMLLKVGRPHTEVEHAVSEANDREAARLYSNVRWLSLAAGVTPLLGLLGTVWGMIQAFFATANLPTGANKAEHLAQGIYVALVTTFAGLSVAIPAAILAHLFEGRIQRLFRELDETLLGLMPQLERFEGRLRVSQDPADRRDGSSQSRGELAAAEGEPQLPAAAPK